MATAPDAFVDLSGVELITENPYDALVLACNNDPAQIQLRYSTHRKIRNEQQKTKLLAPGFAGVVVDPVLYKLVNSERYPEFQDPRHCLVFWARPPNRIRDLIQVIQQKLRTALPSLWLMPPDCLHMTTLEITHSLTAPEIDALVESLKPSAAEITNYTLKHQARLVKPMISYDASALALSFVPAAGEGLGGEGDAYTYHHLRRDIYGLCKNAGVNIASRYTVPSSHLTIARFIRHDEFLHKDNETRGVEKEKLEEWVQNIETINAWLEETYWPRDGLAVPDGGEWIVGQEKGLDFRKGNLWYGGGETVCLGAGS